MKTFSSCNGLIRKLAFECGTTYNQVAHRPTWLPFRPFHHPCASPALLMIAIWSPSLSEIWFGALAAKSYTARQYPMHCVLREPFVATQNQCHKPFSCNKTLLILYYAIYWPYMTAISAWKTTTIKNDRWQQSVSVEKLHRKCRPIHRLVKEVSQFGKYTVSQKNIPCILKTN